LAAKYHAESFSVEAMRLDAGNRDEVLAWINENADTPKAVPSQEIDGAVELMTTAGAIAVGRGDYILKTDEGHFLPCNAPKFEEMFVPDGEPRRRRAVDMDSDWRITGQMGYLRGARLTRSRWVAPRETWDHDHCQFCGEKIDASTEAPAYCTEDHYYWVCVECCLDFRDAFGWVLAGGPEAREGDVGVGGLKGGSRYNPETGENWGPELHCPPQGSWYNQETKERWRPDLHHPPPVGPHWEYTDQGAKKPNEFRVFKGDRVDPK
jgi:hypothetical protein